MPRSRHHTLEPYEKDLTYQGYINELFACVSTPEYLTMADHKETITLCAMKYIANITRMKQIIDTIKMDYESKNDDPYLSEFIVKTQKLIDDYIVAHDPHIHGTKKDGLIIINNYNDLAERIYKNMKVFIHLLEDYCLPIGV